MEKELHFGNRSGPSALGSVPDTGDLARVLGLLQTLAVAVDEIRAQLAGRSKPLYTVEEVADLTGRSRTTTSCWTEEARSSSRRRR